MSYIAEFVFADESGFQISIADSDDYRGIQ